MSANDYDNAIELYSVAIDLDSVSETIFASRCAAYVGKMLWEDALVDAEKVWWYPSSRSPNSWGILRSSNSALRLMLDTS